MRAEAHVALGNLLLQQRDFVTAAASFEQALKIDPEHPWVFGMWLFARALSCEWSGLDTHLASLRAMLLAGKDAATPFIVIALMDSPQLQLRAARNWARRMPAQRPHFARAPGRERVRVGYFSADFHNHPVPALTVGMFEHHDRRRFEIIAMSYGPEKADDMRARLRNGCDRFIDVRGLGDAEIAQASRDLGIDIAIDLQGFTENQRPAIFAHRAAPVQAGYLGYPGTTGAEFTDYLIADRVLIPKVSRAHYTEKIVYLPHSYQANDGRRSIAEREFSRLELGLPERGFVYCCFNNAYKIMPQTFDVWMRILRRVPTSVLWYAPSGDTADTNLRREAGARGVNPERLIRALRLPLLSEHLARHRAADLFLDTLPFNAHTTASDALWAGLPVLTRIGESLAARVAASLLRALGLEELITSSEADYEEQAVALASDPLRLAQIRQQLAAARLSAPLFDTERFTRYMESAYLQMFDQWCRGLAPEDIAVGA
jgi:predicted O-linked N-acetylglucosamine transferase (SPINDLY family)